MKQSRCFTYCFYACAGRPGLRPDFAGLPGPRPDVAGLPRRPVFAGLPGPRPVFDGRPGPRPDFAGLPGPRPDFAGLPGRLPEPEVPLFSFGGLPRPLFGISRSWVLMIAFSLVSILLIISTSSVTPSTNELFDFGLAMIQFLKSGISVFEN
jgi:hypothetical protein